MKQFGVIILLLIASSVVAQNKYFTKSGQISFYSHSPMEDITATNNQVAAIWVRWLLAPNIEAISKSV